MKISFRKIEILLLVVLYLTTLYIWTLPIQKNKMPFGDVDSSSHFTIGDYISMYDKSIVEIPYPITFRYAGQNHIFPKYIWYPPQYWANLALAQVFGGERIVPAFLMVAIFSSLIILSSYFLIRSLFGFWPGFLSSFLLIFSTRDYMIYLWGQWPQSLSFAFTPLILYCFYHYYKNRKDNKNMPIYIYIASLLLSAQFLFHPQGMIASIGALVIFSLIMLAKNKKFPFSIKHLAVAFILFWIVSAAFAPFNIGNFFANLVAKQPANYRQSEGNNFQFDKLFKWYQGIKNDAGLPDFYFEYDKVHGSFQENIFSWWTLPFLLIGLFVLVYRRSENDFLMLSWFVSFYFLTRLIVFGFGQRDIRMFAYEAHVFYPIIAIGLISISSFFRQESLRKYLRFASIALFLILAIFVNGKSAYQTLNGMQYSIGRINPQQYEASEWIRSNLDEKADIYDIGTLGYQNFAAKVKWLGVLSQRHFIVNDNEINLTDYVFLDYTDALLLRNQDYVNSLQNFEKNFQSMTPVYNKNNIRVYKVAGIKI